MNESETGKRLSFEAFCEYIKRNLHGYLSEGFHNHRISVQYREVIKGSGAWSLVISPRNGQGGTVQYLEPFFEAYHKGVPLNEILSGLAERHMDNRSMEQDITEAFEDVNIMKQRIVLYVLGNTKDHELLENLPHKVMGDIAATYRIFFWRNGRMVMSGMVTYEIMEKCGLDPEQLHELAVKNSMKAMPVRLVPMAEMLDDDFGVPGKDQGIIVLQNRQQYNGAAVVFYPDVFEYTGLPMDRYYVVPSSKEEVLLIPKNGITLEEMNAVIKKINESLVSEREILSDLAHEYDPASRQLVIGGTLKRKKEMENNHTLSFIDFTARYR